MFRFEDSHATAIGFTEARTGRDIVGELRELWPHREARRAGALAVLRQRDLFT